MLLPACATGGGPSSSVRIEPGQSVEIAYIREDLRLGLENRTRMAQREDPLAAKREGSKRIEDDAAQVLIDALDGFGFFERATPTAAPGAKELVYVALGGTNYVFSRPQAVGTNHSPESLKRFQENAQSFVGCLAAVQQIYNGTTSFYGGDMTAEQLRAEQDRAYQQGQDAKRRRR